MINLLVSDFYKLKKNKAFLICVILCIVIGALMVPAYEANLQADLKYESTDHDYVEALEISLQTSAVWALKKFLPFNYNALLIGIFIAVFITSEFTYGTVKNTLSRGVERSKIFLSKFLVCSAAALLMQILFILMLVISGSIVWGYDTHSISSFSGVIRVVLTQLLAILSFTALFTFISTAIRAYGGAIAIIILYTTVISTVLTAFSLIFGFRESTRDYWLGGVIYKLAAVTPLPGDVSHGITVVLIWGILSLVIGIILFKKMDVK